MKQYQFMNNGFALLYLTCHKKKLENWGFFC